MEQDLLTLSSIAEQLQLPESTVRYHVKKFSQFIPTIGEGRQRRYQPEAVEILRTVAEMLKNNQTAMEVANRLSQQYPINIKAQEDDNQTATTKPQPTTTTQQQLELSANFKEFWGLHVEMVKQTIEKDKVLLEVMALNKQKNKELSEFKHVMKQARDRIEQLQSEIYREKKRSWWDRLWER